MHVNGLYKRVLSARLGTPRTSLDLAERSFEGLGRQDFSATRGWRQESPAPLLALGDGPGARGWIGPTAPPDDDSNKYHGLCAAMVLAVADCREGLEAEAVGRLVPFAEYIRSDSANWRMAMYCRTFPELLWLLAAAAGADELPIHMLRMVLPENVERSLRVAEGHLSSEDWTTLGQRALGEEQFAAFVERQGRPICRVRLFGGLEVVADDRTIRERDWKKRKARLLFAMLVVRRGQDIPRDQILDHLWPDLPEDKARNNFYVAWSTMKNALVAPEKRAEGCPVRREHQGSLQDRARCLSARMWTNSRSSWRRPAKPSPRAGRRPRSRRCSSSCRSTEESFCPATYTTTGSLPCATSIDSSSSMRWCAVRRCCLSATIRVRLSCSRAPR